MDLKANKVDITPSSVSTTKLIANEWNQLVTENTNVITTGGGLTPSSKDRKQMVASIEKISEDKTKEVMSETYDEISDWVKPKDWIDIRGGAQSNSVYFLVGHSADYTKYGSWGVRVRVSSSGTYDVYVDGVKQATTASNTVTTLNWQTLALTSGYDVTYPEALRTHIVRITPSSSTNTLTEFIQLTDDGIGTLWAHFTTDTVGMYGFTGGYNSNVTFPVLEAVTTNTGTKSITPYGSAAGAFRYCIALIETPIFTGSENNIGIESMFLGCTKLKKIKLENIKSNNAAILFQGCTSLKKIEAKNVIVNPRYNFAKECSSLEDFGNISFDFSNFTTFQDMFIGCSKLKPFVLDMSEGTSATRATIGGTSAARIDGLKGLTVSNSAPFNGSSPQIDVRYTGLNRSALVNLFNSIPYNVGYTVVGSPTITDGVLSNCGASSYLKTSSQIPSNTTEIEGSVVFNCQYLITPDNLAMLVVPNKIRIGINVATEKFGIRYYENGTSNDILLDTVLQRNTTYKAKFAVSAASISISLYQGNTLLETKTENITYTMPTSGDLRIGQAGDSAYLQYSSIDLNETYIKVNGVPWFRGTAAMTKTCNITGATGAASLDNADLAIATSKGWTVTR